MDLFLRVLFVGRETFLKSFLGLNHSRILLALVAAA